MTWQEDREKLREALRLGMQNKTLNGLEATFLCVLVAHMRGKLHMKSYAAKRGGWRMLDCIGPEEVPPEGIPTVFYRRYGDAAARYYRWSMITSLEDQATWIKKFQRGVDFEYGSLHLLAEVVDRVLSKSWDAPVAQQSAEHAK